MGQEHAARDARRRKGARCFGSALAAAAISLASLVVATAPSATAAPTAPAVRFAASAPARVTAPAPPPFHDASGIHVTGVTRADDRLVELTLTTPALASA